MNSTHLSFQDRRLRADGVRGVPVPRPSARQEAAQDALQEGQARTHPQGAQGTVSSNHDTDSRNLETEHFALPSPVTT